MRRAGSFTAPSLFCTARTKGGREGGWVGGREGGEGKAGKETAEDKKTAEKGDTEGGMEGV